MIGNRDTSLDISTINNLFQALSNENFEQVCQVPALKQKAEEYRREILNRLILVGNNNRINNAAIKQLSKINERMINISRMGTRVNDNISAAIIHMTKALLLGIEDNTAITVINKELNTDYDKINNPTLNEGINPEEQVDALKLKVEIYQSIIKNLDMLASITNSAQKTMISNFSNIYLYMINTKQMGTGVNDDILKAIDLIKETLDSWTQAKTQPKTYLNEKKKELLSQPIDTPSIKTVSETTTSTARIQRAMPSSSIPIPLTSSSKLEDNTQTTKFDDQLPFFFNDTIEEPHSMPDQQSPPEATTVVQENCHLSHFKTP